MFIIDQIFTFVKDNDMKIRITQTIIEFDFPDPPEQPAPKPSPPFSFLDMLRREFERAAKPDQPQLDKDQQFHGQFLT